MLRFIYLFLLLQLWVASAVAMCSFSQLEGTSYGAKWALDTKHFSQKNYPITFNVPKELTNLTACFHQENPVFIRPTRLAKNEVEFIFSPLTISFENVPAPSVNQYVYFEEEDDDITFYSTSFVCSGEIPLGSQVMRHSFKKLAYMNSESEDQEVIFISTGTALGDGYTLGQKIKEDAQNYEKFLELYEAKSTSSDLPHYETTNIYVPAVMTGITTKRPTVREQELYTQYFSRTGSNLNGCSQVFKYYMQEYDLKHQDGKNQHPDVTISNHFLQDRYFIKWKTR